MLIKGWERGTSGVKNKTKKKRDDQPESVTMQITEEGRGSKDMKREECGHGIFLRLSAIWFWCKTSWRNHCMYLSVCLYLLVNPDAYDLSRHSKSFTCLLPFFLLTDRLPDGLIEVFPKNKQHSTKKKIISLTPASVRITVICWPAFSDRLRRVNAFPSQQTTSDLDRLCCCCSQREWNLIFTMQKGNKSQTQYKCKTRIFFQANHSIVATTLQLYLWVLESK